MKRKGALGFDLEFLCWFDDFGGLGLWGTTLGDDFGDFTLVDVLEAMLHWLMLHLEVDDLEGLLYLEMIFGWWLGCFAIFGGDSYWLMIWRLCYTWMWPLEAWSMMLDVALGFGGWHWRVDIWLGRELIMTRINDVAVIRWWSERWMSSSSDNLFYILLASWVLLPLRIGLLKLLFIRFKRKQVGTCK